MRRVICCVLALMASSAQCNLLPRRGAKPSTPVIAPDTEIYVPHCVDTEHRNCLTEEAVKLRQRIAKLRRELGRLACKYEGIGPTGGYCLNVSQHHDDQGLGGNDYMDPNVAMMLVQLFCNSSVLDLGCGMGLYGKVFTQHGIDWLGVDGAENVEAATAGRVKWLDLSVPHWLGNQRDWVMSLEVGEHLPRQYEQTFIGNVVRHARCGAVLSWAVVGQLGHHHVNNRDNGYVIRKLQRQKFMYHADQSSALRKVAAAAGGETPWFSNTIMVFYRQETLAEAGCAAAHQLKLSL